MRGVIFYVRRPNGEIQAVPVDFDKDKMVSVDGMRIELQKIELKEKKKDGTFVQKH